MRYAKIEKCDYTNGEGIGVALFIQGCPIHCPGCFSPETWDYSGGHQYIPEEHGLKILELMKPDYITRFSILGGESLSLENYKPLIDLCSAIKKEYPEKKIWLWTGYTYKKIQQAIQRANDDFTLSHDQDLKILLSYVDYLIAGPFIQEEKDLTLKWRGSRNQEIIKLKEGYWYKDER